MGQYTSYWMFQRYITIGNQDPIPDYPNYWSVDADGTLPKITKLENDEECGYRPDVQYRWVNMDITKDYYCDECSVMTRWVKSNETICVSDGPEPQYRTLTTATTCVGYDLHVLEEHQVSTDGGITWTTTATTTGSLIEADSEDCGYVPPTNKKLVANYSGGQTYELKCNSNTTLTSGNTHPSGYQASAMTSAVIGNCVTTIGVEAFQYCYSLTSITIPDSVIDIGEEAFRSCTSLTSVTIPDSVTIIGYGAFSGCSRLTSVSLGNSVIDIGRYAFTDCRNLTSITIPDSVTTIGDEAFERCSGLTSCTIGSGVTTISGYAFRSCTSLTSVTIPNSVISILYWAFERCSGLTSVSLGDSVTTIGNGAFSECTSLTSVTVNAVVPPTLGNRTFYETRISAIYVPSASVDAYKSATGWSTYASIIQAIP